MNNGGLLLHSTHPTRFRPARFTRHLPARAAEEAKVAVAIGRTTRDRAVAAAPSGGSDSPA